MYLSVFLMFPQENDFIIELQMYTYKINTTYIIIMISNYEQ